MRPYPTYTPTTIPWLPKVPEHWEVVPNRALFTEVKEEGRAGDEMLSVTIERGVLRQADYLANSTKKDSSRKDASTYKRVAEGDIVYNKMRAWQGAFGRSNYQGIVSPAYVVQRPTAKAHPDYYHYLLRTPLFAKEAERNSYGLASDIWNLRPEHFKNIVSVCPPLGEQHLIVRYLRAKEAQVKRYIRAKRKLIAALQEKKQAIIQQAVTRGLDPNVKLKPSGVEWLGDVPEHWEVRSNRSMLRIRKVQVGERSNKYVLLSLTLRGVIARDMENPEGKFPAEFNTYQEVRPADLVFCLFDVDETPRTVGLSTLHGMITGAYTVFECIVPSIARFLYYFYLAVDHQKSLKPFYTGLRKVVQKSTFLGIKVAVPPKSEIEPILTLLEKEVGSVDAGIARVEQEIKLMTEYHTRLIADVVTGAVDVREAARALPEETDIEGPEEEAPGALPMEMEEETENE